MEIGIIAGSGFYRMEGMAVKEKIKMETPYGSPSSEIVVGEIAGKEVAFLSRHAEGHLFIPSHINYRANIYAFKLLRIKKIFSVSAVGSLREEIKPGDFVVPDQLIDFTKNRINTFFEPGLAGHVSMAHPFCEKLRNLVISSSGELGIKTHKEGTYICIEGPQFSTKGESNLFRGWGADVIGMTNLPEAKLAREAEMCYCTIALVTDYDCWHESEEKVTVEIILKVMTKNVERVKALLKRCIEKMKDEDCECNNSLKDVFVTNPSKVDEKLLEKLKVIVGRYFEKKG